MKRCAKAEIKFVLNYWEEIAYKGLYSRDGIAGVFVLYYYEVYCKKNNKSINYMVVTLNYTKTIA